jgi:DNA-directed RNA polymerase specialized sigma24 family protein
MQQSGQSTESMAAQLGIDTATVASRLFRARARLRVMAEEETKAVPSSGPARGLRRGP